MLKIKHTAFCDYRIFFLGFALFLCAQANSQDYHYSQFYANKLFLGPSFAGATQQNRVIANYRNQWPGIKGFVTYSASFDHNFVNFNSGLGLIVLKDAAGSMNYGTLKVGLCYSFDFALNESYHLRPGLGFSFLQRSIDYSKAVWVDQLIDPTSGSSVANGKNKVSGVDSVSSVILYSQNVWFGYTIDHLLKPNLSLLNAEDRSPLKHSLYGGVTVIRRGRLLKPVDETVSIAAQFSDQGPNRQLDMGLYWAKSPLTFGLWYRGIPPFNSDRGDAFTFLVGIKQMHFSFGYSYDFTISNLINHSAGAHEISVAYEFYTVKKKKLQAVPCPEF